MRAKKSTSGLIVFLVILAVIAALTYFSIFGIRGSRGGTPRERIFGKEYVAVLGISGVIQNSNKTYNQQWLLDTIDEIHGDKKNLGLLVNIDSPGGSVYESDEVYLALQDYARDKPLRAYLGPIAASGGYYIACAAPSIIANRNTLTGSIGVISSQSVDLTKLLDTYGVSVTTITAGKNKNMLNYNSPLTDEQRAIMQAIADECYDQFVGIVAASRHIEEEAVRTLADGRVYTAKQARDAALIDDIASFDDTLDKLRSALAQKTAGGMPDVLYFDYYPKPSLSEIIFGIKRGGLFALRGSPGSAGSADSAARFFAEELLVDMDYPAFMYQGAWRND